MEKASSPLWLSEEQVQDLLTPEEAYAAVAKGLVCHARGQYQQPLKPYIRPKGREEERTGGRFIAMPAFLGGKMQAAGIKWIAGFPANIDIGLPRASGLVALNSTETGRLLALMPCETLSARRTAAVASLSVDYLAQSGEKRIAMIGAGPIAKSVLEALGSGPDRNIAEVRLCDLRVQRAEELARLLAQSGKRLPHIQVSDSAEESIRHANVIVTATTGSKGYIKNEWIQEGALSVPLSLDDCEPDVLLSADKVLVDDFDQCCREEKLLHRLVQAGQFSRERIYALLGEVVAGMKEGRTNHAERIYMNAMGMAVEDVAAAQAVYNKARERGVGYVLP